MQDSDRQWFCLRSKPRRQNVAAAHLRSFGIEVFNPTLRRRKPSSRGAVWRVEPLFPNYVFARFDLHACFRRVRYGLGVSDIVSFGGRWAVVPEAQVERLQAEW